MEVNKDEAIRCLAISQKHLEAGNFPSARKFCLKSISLYETPEARKLLDRIDGLASRPSSSSKTESTSKSQAETHPSAAGMKHRSSSSKTNGNGTAGGMGGDNRDYTPEQAAVVKRVRSCKVTAYYEILAVKKDCDEAEIKKAYRKVSLNSPLFSYCLLIDFSWLWLCIPIKMVLQEQTKHLSVSIVFTSAA